jgi:hypothetical protein
LNFPRNFKKSDEISERGKRDFRKRKLPLNSRRKSASFGTTTRLRFSAFQTLSFSNRLTFTLRSSSELKFTLATKKCATNHLCHHPLNTLGIEFYLEHRSSPAHRTNWLFFYFEKIHSLSCKAYPTKFSKVIFSNFDPKP